MWPLPTDFGKSIFSKAMCLHLYGVALLFLSCAWCLYYPSHCVVAIIVLFLCYRLYVTRRTVSFSLVHNNYDAGAVGVMSIAEKNSKDSWLNAILGVHKSYIRIGWILENATFTMAVESLQCLQRNALPRVILWTRLYSQCKVVTTPDHTHTQIQTNSTQTTKRTVHKRPTNFYNTGVRYNLAFVAPNFDRASMTTLRFVATSNKRTATSGATAQQRDRGTHQCWTASQASRMAARIGVLGTSIYSWRWRNMLHWTLLGDVYLYNPIHEYMYNIYVNSAVT